MLGSAPVIMIISANEINSIDTVHVRFLLADRGLYIYAVDCQSLSSKRVG